MFTATAPGRTSVVLAKLSTSPPTAEAYTDFTYDTAKRLATIEVQSGTTTFGYDDENFPATVTFPSGLIETTTRTSGHAPSTRAYSVSAVDTLLNRWYRTDSLSRLVARGGAGAQFQTFAYDSTDQLRTWTKKTRMNTPSCINTGG